MRRFLPLGLLCCMALTAAGQSTPALTTRDKVEITYRAELLIRELEGLMNLISSDGLGITEINELIANSCAPSTNQLFASEKSVVEEDISPSAIDRATTRDVEAGRYLRDLDALYAKSLDQTISFSAIRTSKVYEQPYPYTQVYFESRFSGSHKTLKAPYQPTRRVAYVRAVQEQNQWKVVIESIVFFRPEKPLEEETYEVELTNILPDTVGMEQREKLRLIEQQKQFQQEIVSQVRKEIELLEKQKEQKNVELANSYVREGDEAMARKSYALAVQAYSQALALYSDVETFRKRSKAQEAIEREARAQEERSQRFSDLVRLANQAAQLSEYQRSVTMWKMAQAVNPRARDIEDSIARLNNHLVNLDRLLLKQREGDLPGAVRDLGREIKDHPADADLYMLRGQLQEQQQKPKQAIEDYTQALKLNPKYRPAYVARGRLQEQAGETAQADLDYSQGLALWNGDTALYVMRAELRRRSGKTADAVSDYSAAIRLDSLDGNLFLQRGLLYEALNLSGKAYDDYSSALSADRRLAEAWYRRGMLRVKENDLPGAARDFGRAQENSLQPALAQEISALVTGLFNQGRDLKVKADYAAAIRPLSDAIILRPSFAEAYYLRAGCRQALDQKLEALADYQAAVESDSTFFEAFFDRGQLRVAMGNLPEAIRDFENAVRYKPDLLAGWQALGDARSGVRSYEDALTAYRKAISLNPEAAAVQYRAGYAAQQLGRHSEALPYLSQAIKLQSTYPEAYCQRGIAYYTLKDLPKATADLSEAIKQKPDFAQAYNERSRVYQALLQPEKALPDLDAAIRLNIRTADVYLRRARAGAALGQYEKSIADYEQALLLADSVRQAGVLTEAGEATLALSRWDQAREWFAQALELDGGEAGALYGMALSYIGSGKPDEAFPWLERAFQTGRYNLTMVKKDKRLKVVKKLPQYKTLISKYLQ
ncbi:MAG: tetratricopeptide repeat protein [Bacteroidia bacterium]|nr:tetratricopeptide repeat protein [Bacteroidia bacterium]